MNPFDLPGPEFLAFFAIMFVVVFAVAAYCRYAMRRPADEVDIAADDLDPLEVAYLSGGAKRTVDAAIAKLVHGGVLEASLGRLAKVRNLPANANPLERAIVGATKGKEDARIAEVRDAAEDALEPVREKLKQMGLLVADPRSATAMPFVLAMTIPVTGLIKIGVGISRDRPVLFLVFGTVFSLIAACAFLYKVHRSRRGDRVLAKLKDENAALDVQFARRIEDVSGSDLTLAVGLFGLGVLARSPLSSLESTLHPRPTHSSSGGGCSSCGGGGGGCGGGCGGCGG